MRPRPVIGGKYLLLQKIASGGMAEVYLGMTLLAPNQMVILKKILPHYIRDKTVIDLFHAEKEILSMLQHENIVKYLDFVQQKSSCYLVLEYIDGRDLRQLSNGLKNEGKILSIKAAIGIVVQACQGLHYAHQKKIVHRDISPPNIMVSKTGLVRILDFGVARPSCIDEKETLCQGRVNYMAPEQLLGHPVDARGDVFSLGVVFFELIFEKKPFSRKDSRTLTECSALPREAMPGDRVIPASLWAILAQALTLDPAERFENCCAFQKALEDWAASEGFDVSRSQIANEIGPFFPPEQDEKFRSTKILRTSLVFYELWQDRFFWLTAISIMFLLVIGICFLGRGNLGVTAHPIAQFFKGGGPHVHALKIPKILSDAQVEKITKPNGHEQSKNQAIQNSGRLRVAVKPWGRVFIGEKLFGDTPFAPIELPAGDYVVRIENPDLQAVALRKVRIYANKDYTLRVVW